MGYFTGTDVDINAFGSTNWKTDVLFVSGII